MFVVMLLVNMVNRPSSATQAVAAAQVTVVNMVTNTSQPVATRTSTPIPTVLARDLPVKITQQGADMVLVPAGTFRMGSNTGNSDQKPLHEVTMAAFYMDVYEVTNSLYYRCVSAGICLPPSRQRR